MAPTLRTQAQYRALDHNVRIDAWLCLTTTGTVQACISPLSVRFPFVDSTGQCNTLALPEQRECCHEAETADLL